MENPVQPDAVREGQVEERRAGADEDEPFQPENAVDPGAEGAAASRCVSATLFAHIQFIDWNACRLAGRPKRMELRRRQGTRKGLVGCECSVEGYTAVLLASRCSPYISAQVKRLMCLEAGYPSLASRGRNLPVAASYFNSWQVGIMHSFLPRNPPMNNNYNYPLVHIGSFHYLQMPNSRQFLFIAFLHTLVL